MAGPLQSLAPGNLQRVLHTNLLAPMLLTQALLPHLRSLPVAQVLFVGSALGRLGLPGFSAYSASKFGLRGFAVENQARNSTVFGSAIRSASRAAALLSGESGSALATSS